MDINSIAHNQLKDVSTGQMVTLESLWKDKACVIIFFRRWGCVFCRVWAKEISKIAPVLRENNVRLIGVGVEELGVEDFVNGKFFDGDVDKSTYKALSFKRFGLFSILAALFSSEARAAMARGRQLKVGGDMRGDKVQVGGALVVSAGGKEVLLNFKQERPAEHLPNIKFFEALGIQHLAPKEENSPVVNGVNEEEPKCTEDTCSVPAKEEVKTET
ncbi:prostamide/prostaglandin F synthase isoform X2 [Anabrus simplex]|uniref:prostamide/prostaglandin F synthase isoform X2 n=1 Tax=Anabrus simplex TaxID=316456 RepID=UPI0035A2CFC6